MPDPISHVRFSSVFPKKAWTISCKTLIWMTWSDLGQTHLVQKQASVQESSSPVSGRTQPAHYHYQFPTFRLSCVLPQTAQIILCKTRLDLIRFWLTVSGFGQTDPVRKQSGVQESSNPLLTNASKPIRIGCSVQNQAGSDLVLADCPVLAKWTRSGSKLVCRNHPTRF